MVILRDIRLRWCMLSLSNFYCFFSFFFLVEGGGSEMGSFAGSLLAMCLSVIVSITIHNHHSFIPSFPTLEEERKERHKRNCKRKERKNHR